ncbi:MAG TPA: histidinol dehydrogenase, partial [Thermoanaerobaculia bacterium]|nr:histidinol dehydrogenase [Thermoanaerobaculia bacterium]
MSPLNVVKADSRAGRRAVEGLTRRGEAVLDVKTLRRAEKIVQEVRKRGDRALLDFARKLDGAQADSAAGLALSPPVEDASGANLPAGFAEALERAIGAVERFHAPQARTGYRLEEDGVELEERITPLQRVGLYVPGGRASYPSTVVMTVIPARVAGVKEIAVATPAAAYRSNPALRYALSRLGVTEVWGMGGAHAVAAFAYGTETVRRVDKIAGPGNAWVTAAKKLVMGDVAVDGLAGPSEVVIVADASADPGDIAADLLAQAEHDPLAAAVLITTDPKLGKRVSAEIDRQLGWLSTAETARASLANFGAGLVVKTMEEALELVERIAPEHLQLVGADAEALADQVRAAGAIFIGAASPEVFGDYIAGPSHVLPTCGSARFASSLGVEDFLRRSHTIRL